MTNWRDGSINFEQRGVEFPAEWSINATNIVTTKYFRGAVGGPQRENSLRQLIDRVVLTYGAAGREHGYFADRKSTRLNSSHANISYAVFCLKKKYFSSKVLPLLITNAHTLVEHLPTPLFYALTRRTINDTLCVSSRPMPRLHSFPSTFCFYF